MPISSLGSLLLLSGPKGHGPCKNSQVSSSWRTEGSSGILLADISSDYGVYWTLLVRFLAPSAGPLACICLLKDWRGDTSAPFCIIPLWQIEKGRENFIISLLMFSSVKIRHVYWTFAKVSRAFVSLGGLLEWGIWTEKMVLKMFFFFCLFILYCSQKENMSCKIRWSQVFCFHFYI